MVPTTKEELRRLVSETTIEMYEEMTPQLIKLIDETKHDDSLTEAQKQDEISYISWDMQKLVPMRLLLKCWHRF